MSGEIQNLLFNRETGQGNSFDLYLQNTWSLSVISIQSSPVPVFPIATEIVSVDCKENYVICLTNRGEGYFFNCFLPDEMISLRRNDEHIFKLSFSGNSILIMLSDSLSIDLKFYLMPLPIKNSEERIQILEHLSLNLKDIVEYDIYNQNLLIFKQSICRIITFPSADELFQSSSRYPYYNRNHIIFINTFQNSSLITSTHLQSNQKYNFTIEDTERIMILDHFEENLFFIHNQKVKVYNLAIGQVIEVSEVPEKYFVGKVNSVAQFHDGIRIMVVNTRKIYLKPSLVCADLANVVAVYVENRGVFMLDVSGSIRQVIFPTAKIRALSMNRETGQLVLCTKRSLYFYD
ncbi:hypothetical protein SteCoe_13304 [Stentor coeruleus]|uniref:CNH domain-containing protein n=1 Tax=Stentor coeruleus TaxID=5963 RepID=A0A1R2C8Q4_9CILI|nr:hypothetical protein SteCoe_15016 [Stentor coeruleus]OMJ85394.1 hypothetical protein SteCoe_13304 [Stentor coeruleus]